MIDRLKREPAVVIGIIGTVALAVIQSLSGQGVIGPDIAATVIGFIDNTATPVPLDGWGLLLITGIVIRFFVTSASAPAVKEGTLVTVVTPPGEPNREIVA